MQQIRMQQRQRIFEPKQENILLLQMTKRQKQKQLQKTEAIQITERMEQSMAAIYKNELRSYFTSMTGYICMAFMLVAIGIYYAVINLASGYPYFGYTLSCVIVLFLLMTPVLTMRILAEEKSRKTDQLLLTAPVSLWKIVVGKYLDLCTVIALPSLDDGIMIVVLWLLGG